MPKTVAHLTYNNFAKIAARLPKATAEVVEKHTLAIEETIKAEMAAPKSGRAYGSHIASAPGEAPAIDTGKLFGSVQHEIEGAQGAVYTEDVEYAVFLEYGTSRMAARPVWAPAAEQQRPLFERDMADLEKRL